MLRAKVELYGGRLGILDGLLHHRTSGVVVLLPRRVVEWGDHQPDSAPLLDLARGPVERVEPVALDPTGLGQRRRVDAEVVAGAEAGVAEIDRLACGSDLV